MNCLTSPFSNRRVLIFLVSLILGLLTSCGDKEDIGKDVVMVVLPSTTIIAPGRKSSCNDLLTSQVAGTIPGQSVTGPFFYFPKFVLQWKSKDRYLYISGIRVTVRGAGISDFEKKAYLDSDELLALIGTDVMGPNTISDSTVVSSGMPTPTPTPGPSATPDPSPTFVSRQVKCGFAFGGLQLAGGEDTPSFTAQITVELIGYSAKENFADQQFVRETIDVSADFVQY